MGQVYVPVVGACAPKEEDPSRPVLILHRCFRVFGWVAEFKHSLARVPTGSLKWVPKPQQLPYERGGRRDTRVRRASLKDDSIECRSGVVPPKRAIFKPPERVFCSLLGVWVWVGVFGGVLPSMTLPPQQPTTHTRPTNDTH
jgi:hypothetical protein